MVVELSYTSRQIFDNKSDIYIFEILVISGLQICFEKKSFFGTTISTFTTSEQAGFEPAIFG